jgi:hypothetical protein
VGSLLLLLLSVHELVRFVQKLLKVSLFSRICGGYSYAERKRVAAAWAGIARIQFLLNSAKNHAGAVFVHIGNENRKLIPADPGKDVRPTARVS